MTLIRAGLAAVAMAGAAAGALASDDPYQSIRDAIALCETCHGENGASTEPTYPIIAGQHQHYLYLQLRDFKSGRRAGAEMSAVVEALDNDRLRLLARYYAEQTWRDAPAAATPEQARVARAAITAGQCVQCHLGGFEGASGVPRVAGQWPQYLDKTMVDFKTKARANAPAKSALMAAFSEAEIAALAAYLGAL